MARERLTLTILATSTVVFGLATLVVGYVVWSLDQVQRLDVAESLTAAPESEPVTAADVIDGGVPAGAPAAAEGESRDGFEEVAPYRPDRPAENYLIVGSDSVEGIADGDEILTDREDEAQNHLADTIMILRLRPDSTAAVVSVPRDLLVEVAGTGRNQLINSAYNIDEDPADRAARLIDTVEANLDISLQHFVEIDLDGFRRLVDAVGGVSVCFDQPIRDRNTDDTNDPNRGGTGFISDAGVQELDGERALQYVRSRHLYVLEGEEWVRLGVWNDLERNGRQQQFVFDAVDQALADSLSSPNTLRQLLDIVAGNVSTSDTISLFDDGFDLARLFRSFDADAQLERYAFDFLDGQRGSVVGLELASTPHNRRVIDVFAGVGWNDVVESRVAVEVTGPDRVDVAAELASFGFVVGSSSAPAGDATVLRYGPGGETAAALLLSHLRDDVELVGDLDLAPDQLVLALAAEPPTMSADYRSVELPPAVTVPPTPSSTPPDSSAGDGSSTSAPPDVEVAGVCGS